jgi:hypothetical protein
MAQLDLAIDNADPQKPPEQIIWAAAEFYVYLPGSPFGYIEHNEMVSYSRSRAGLTRQLNFHAYYRKNTAEAWFMGADDMERELRYVLYSLAIPRALVDLDGLSDEAYSWRSDETWAQMRLTQDAILRTLHVESLHQEAARTADARPGSRDAENHEAVSEALARITAPVGRVLRTEQFLPKPYDPDNVDKTEEREQERTTACVMCSL